MAASKSKKKMVLLGAAVLLLCIAVGVFMTLKPSAGDNPSLPGDTETGQSQEVSGKGYTEDGEVIIGGQASGYKPGDYGAVVVEGPSREDFASDAAWADYEENWHDKKWRASQEDPGGYKYAHYEQDSSGSEWVAGEVVAAFSSGTSEEEINAVAQSNGLIVGLVTDAISETDYVTVQLYSKDDSIDPMEVAAAVQSSSDSVIAAFPNMVSSTDGVETSGARVSSSAEDYNEQDYLLLSRFDKAWTKVKCNGSVSVAVFDGGINFEHEDLAGNIDTGNAYDAINNLPLTKSVDSSNGHGTHVSGIVSARAGNRVGLAGCSYNARIIPIRVLNENGRGSTFDIYQGLIRISTIKEKPSVVNMSLGLKASDWTAVVGALAYQYLCQGVIDSLAEDDGVVFVAAAGNQGNTTNVIEYPAALDNVIGVASVSNEETRASSSTANDTVDICAQGVDVVSTGFGGGYKKMSGTSMATPQVAAAAALVRVMHPAWSSARIESHLELTAKKVAGMTDVDSDGKDATGQYGYGLLDAAAAVGYSASSGGSSAYSGGAL